MVEIIVDEKSINFEDKENSQRLKIIFEESKILLFNVQPLVAKFIITDEELCNLLNELYSKTMNKYGCKYGADNQREHDRLYVFGNYRLCNRDTNTVTWFSESTFNQFGDLSNGYDFSSVKPQFFSITKDESKFILTCTNQNPEEEFSLLPKEFGGKYRPNFNRGAQDFLEDIYFFYNSALALAKRNISHEKENIIKTKRTRKS